MSDTKSDFSDQIERHQLAWRNDPANGISPGAGWQNGKQRPWIFPTENGEQNLWPGIRSGSIAANSEMTENAGYSLKEIGTEK